MFVIDAAPHGWLFPRMAAVVYHGGAGTTAEGLRAGKPTVIVPFSFDQLFWGKRDRQLGVGADPLRARQLTASQLVGAIRTVTSDPGMKLQAEALGQAIRAEDGRRSAVEFIQQYLRAYGCQLTTKATRSFPSPRFAA